jgi:hypothetical protein
MASNDPEEPEVPLPDTGAVAFLTRIVHAPVQNEQTPLRVACIIVLAVVLALTPVPWTAVGFVALAILALSLGRIIPKA